MATQLPIPLKTQDTEITDPVSAYEPDPDKRLTLALAFFAEPPTDPEELAEANADFEELKRNLERYRL